jgi:hypothetical protein
MAGVHRFNNGARHRTFTIPKSLPVLTMIDRSHAPWIVAPQYITAGCGSSFL